MDPLPLRELALKEVSRYIALGKYNNVDYELNPDHSNRINKLSMGCTFNLLEQFQTKLNITVADYRRSALNKATFEMLKKQNLEHLYLAPLDNWKKEYSDQNGHFKIVSFLKDMLNEESALKMKQLDISHLVACEHKWAISLGNFLPNLENLDIALLQLDQNDFLDICQNFGTLKVLKMNTAGLKNLNGIANLKNLEVLIAKNLDVSTSEDLMELFECTKIKFLDFSRYKRTPDNNFMEVYLSCERVLEDLIFFDCRNQDIDDVKLEKLLKTHRNLRRLVVHGTELKDITVPGIELLDRSTLESFVNCIQHAISIRDNLFMTSMCQHLNRVFLSTWVEDGDVDVPMLPRVLNVVCQALDTFVCYSPIVTECVAISKLITSEKLMKHLSPKDIVTLIQALETAGRLRMLMKVPLNNEIWEIISQKHILDLPYLPVRSVCWFAIKSLNNVNKPVIETQEYIVLEKLMSRLYPEDLETFYNLVKPIAPMTSLIRFAYQQPKPFMTEHRSKIKMALDWIYESTKRSSKAFQQLTECDIKSKSFFQVLMNLCQDQWKGLPEQSRALEIIVNLTRSEDFEDTCGKYLMQEVPYLVGMLKSDSSTSFRSIAILSSLICCKLPKKGFYDFWSKINLRIINLCSKREIKPAVNLDIFLNSSILKETFLNSYLDGPKMWALLTMRTMLQRNGNVGEKFKKSGLVEIMKNYRTKDKKAGKMKDDVMVLMIN